MRRPRFTSRNAPAALLAMTAMLGVGACARYTPLEDAPESDEKPRFSQALAGYWMSPGMGDVEERCTIDFWAQFEPPNTCIETAVKRGSCEDRGVNKGWGVYWTSLNQTVEIQRANPEGVSDLIRFTAAIADSCPEVLRSYLLDGAVAGSRALTPYAYLSDDGGSTFFHEHRRQWVTPEGNDLTYRNLKSLTELGFDAPLTATSIPMSCRMTVSITASASSGPDAEPLTGSEIFELPCTYGPDNDSGSGWIRLTADGFENSPRDGLWAKYMYDQGVGDRHDPLVQEAILLAYFFPVFLFDPQDPSTLYQDLLSFWFIEMLTPPPTQLE